MLVVANRPCKCGNPVLFAPRIGKGGPPGRRHLCAERDLPTADAKDIDAVSLWLSEHKHDHPFPLSNAQTRSEALRLINARGGDTNGQE